MNVNKTEKLLAARKKLKEFQQNKSCAQENIPDRRKDRNRFDVSKASSKNVELLPDINYDVAQNPENPGTEIIESSSNDATVGNNSNLKNSAEVSSYFRSELADEFCKKENSSEQIQECDTFGDALNKKCILERDADIAKLRDLPTNRGSIASAAAAVPSPLLGSSNINGLEMPMAVDDATTDSTECSQGISHEIEYEDGNKFLISQLREQKEPVNLLEEQISRYKTCISELETKLATKDDEFEAKLTQEINPLKNQLLVHSRTTEILVTEKAELNSIIERCERSADEKSKEIEELGDRLKTSQIRILELEKELSLATSVVADTRNICQRLRHDRANLEKRCNDLENFKDEGELELSEFRQELNLKNAEILNLQCELEKKNKLLSMSELKIQQLTSTPQEMRALEDQYRATAALEQQLSELRVTLKSVNREKDDAAKQYENYVRQSDSRYENTLKDLEESRKKIVALEDRERSYIQRLSDLEQNFQREKQKVEETSLTPAYKEQVEHLTKSLEALNEEHKNLRAILNERNAEIEILKCESDELRESMEDNVQKSKLASALSSEQAAASRAIAQNQQLKVQLNEMHDAFVGLSNSKLDLTEQLQAERAIGKKLNAKLNKVEERVEDLEEQLRLKKIALDELENEKLQTAQIADQMHHYQAQSHQARTLQQELQNSLGCIEILRRENQRLISELNKPRDQNTNEKRLSNGDDSIKNVDENERETDMVRASSDTSSDARFAISDPLKKLETRFKDAMERVAELTDEKQRLEHLVLQLQGETETIGEYVTLYQKQRGILQKKAQEREQMFRQLVEQRNHQRERLHRLQLLVSDLIEKKSLAELDGNSSSSVFPELENDRQEIHSRSSTADDNIVDAKDETASKILHLLTEIKDCKDTCILEPNFHPCPWCSGKLITI